MQHIQTSKSTPSEVRRVLLPFSIRERSTLWFDSFDRESVESFEELKSLFITKYYPLTKINELRVGIQQFK